MQNCNVFLMLFAYYFSFLSDCFLIVVALVKVAHLFLLAEINRRRMKKCSVKNDLISCICRRECVTLRCH